MDGDRRMTNEQAHRAILVGVETEEDISYSMEELARLAETADIRVAGQLVQRMGQAHANTYIGKGKLNELAELCSNMDITLVVTNDELSGLQLRNMEQALSVPVIDRTLLILDIFAARARSREGKLQVEMAQLQYRLPRLTGLGKTLSRLGAGIGTRGPGEKKLETDRRHIKRRIREIGKEMDAHRRQRSVRRARSHRARLPVVALVGYTNAGKSSVMNRLLAMEEREDKGVLEQDVLFTTLDASRRLITTEERVQFLLVDTVGFVSKLPHHLVKAFHSTLEEVVEADLLLHVVDATFPDVDFHIEVTRRVLEEVGVFDKPTLLVFNKADLLAASALPMHGPNALVVSAKTGQGFVELLRRIELALMAESVQTEVLVPYDRGEIVSYLCSRAVPEEMSHTEHGTKMSIALHPDDRERVRAFIVPGGEGTV